MAKKQAKSDWQIEREKRIAEEEAAYECLTQDQMEAIDITYKALKAFICEWSDGFEIYDVETPRKLQKAFWSIHNHFHIVEGDDE
jgi:hypothetical protein